MLNDVTWRKMPTDILTNETMTFIESQMPKGYEYAPFMFYQAALKRADEYGSFDIGDGVIFARLMRVPERKIVFDVALLMARYGFIKQIAKGSNRCLMCDWDYQNNKVPRTIEERRKVVSQLMAAEEQRQRDAAEFSTPEEAPDFSFSCPDDDKNTKNVVKTVNDDKIQKNVVKNTDDDKNTKNVVTQREREKEREREERDTHTERESLREGETAEVGTSAESLKSSATVPTEKEALSPETKKDSEKKESEPLPTPSIETETLVTQALSEQGNDEKREGANFTVEAILEAFFVENNLGYKVAKGKKTVTALTSKIMELGSKTVSPEKIAKLCCDQFKTMHDGNAHWKDIPLTPTYMNNNSVWAAILSGVGDKLKAKSQKTNFLEAAKKYEAEATEERDKGLSEIDANYRAYGIDPSDPAATMKLIKAKSIEQAKPPEEKAYEGDIF